MQNSLKMGTVQPLFEDCKGFVGVLREGCTPIDSTKTEICYLGG